MRSYISRRNFMQSLGLSAASIPLWLNLQSLGFASHTNRKQRLVIIFSPNGVVKDRFWPEHEEDELSADKYDFKPILSPLAPYKQQTLVLKGVCDKIKGDGDNHMRGIGCLLTGGELFPGNIQGGSDTPAGWATGISIDQEIKKHFQSRPETQTRFGSLEFGVVVPERADTWTRMVYAGGNKPIAPISDPYAMFNKLYGQTKDRESLKSVLDDLQEDLRKIKEVVSSEDAKLLEEHANLIRETEMELQSDTQSMLNHPVPELESGVRNDNENMPRISKMQIDLMVNSFIGDFSRIATLQFTNSVGQAKMKWLGVEEGHHELSHEPNSNAAAQDKLTKINTWYCEQIAYLAKRLAETPEPSGDGSMLDNTTIIWTNELGEGNSHTLNDIPFVLIGGGLNFKMGRSLHLPRIAHNRLLLSIAHGMGHHIDRFGNPNYCGDGPLVLS
jgi:hypothetical protein